MATLTSKDGSTIGYDTTGSGPVIILVAGATQYRAVDNTTPRLIEMLSARFTVVNYDRRGRGESTEVAPYAVAREIEDIEALIDAHGGRAGLYGMSSGAVLALEAGVALPGKVTGVLLYEPPVSVEQSSADYWKQHAEVAAMAERGDADGMMSHFMGAFMSPEELAGFKQSPAWPPFAAVGLTIEHDYRVMAEAKDGDRHPARWQAIAVPVLVVNGDSSFPFIDAGAAWVAAGVPRAQRRVLAGQGHDVSPEALAPVMTEFFGAF
ncbi:alpha/beta fold hydrolase [Devosia sediminis]|uniref:Alpha/beta hydrolase n=1 Tax=Devosia sediminis TaxID=2798801 RepID=A0A934ITK8_9HYPH|nr:alpha/beta hydrolase [Devosia sediminis]MBJ3784911.1 alpha/beta hydrolase [Devosia sediminis]